jgi:hypothetical protein
MLRGRTASNRRRDHDDATAVVARDAPPTSSPQSS